MLRRFYINEINPPIGWVCGLSQEETHHLKSVLRLKKGSEIEIFDAKGNLFSGIVADLSEEEAQVKIEALLKGGAQTKNKVILAYALSKGKKVDLVIQKTTELGIDEILIFESERSVVEIASEKKEKRLERYCRIVLEAAKQCRRNTVPVINIVDSIEEVLKSADSETVIIEADAEAETNTRGEKFSAGKNYMIIVGPEGGFSKQEKEYMRSKGVFNVSFGGNVLRTETAAIAAVAIVKFLNNKE